MMATEDTKAAAQPIYAQVNMAARSSAQLADKCRARGCWQQVKRPEKELLLMGFPAFREPASSGTSGKSVLGAAYPALKSRKPLVFGCDNPDYARIMSLLDDTIVDDDEGVSEPPLTAFNCPLYENLDLLTGHGQQQQQQTEQDQQRQQQQQLLQQEQTCLMSDETKARNNGRRRLPPSDCLYATPTLRKFQESHTPGELLSSSAFGSGTGSVSVSASACSSSSSKLNMHGRHSSAATASTADSGALMHTRRRWHGSESSLHSRTTSNGSGGFSQMPPARITRNCTPVNKVDDDDARGDGYGRGHDHDRDGRGPSITNSASAPAPARSPNNLNPITSMVMSTSTLGVAGASASGNIDHASRRSCTTSQSQSNSNDNNGLSYATMKRHAALGHATIAGHRTGMAPHYDRQQQPVRQSHSQTSGIAQPRRSASLLKKFGSLVSRAFQAPPSAPAAPTATTSATASSPAQAATESTGGVPRSRQSAVACRPRTQVAAIASACEISAPARVALAFATQHRLHQVRGTTGAGATGHHQQQRTQESYTAVKQQQQQQQARQRGREQQLDEADLIILPTNYHHSHGLHQQAHRQSAHRSGVRHHGRRHGGASKPRLSPSSSVASSDGQPSRAHRAHRRRNYHHSPRVGHCHADRHRGDAHRRELRSYHHCSGAVCTTRRRHHSSHGHNHGHEHTTTHHRHSGHNHGHHREHRHVSRRARATLGHGMYRRGAVDGVDVAPAARCRGHRSSSAYSSLCASVSAASITDRSLSSSSSSRSCAGSSCCGGRRAASLLSTGSGASSPGAGAARLPPVRQPRTLVTKWLRNSAKYHRLEAPAKTKAEAAEDLQALRLASPSPAAAAAGAVSAAGGASDQERKSPRGLSMRSNSPRANPARADQPSALNTDNLQPLIVLHDDQELEHGRRDHEGWPKSSSRSCRSV